MPADVAAIAEELGRSRKYRHLCPDTLRRIAAWAARPGGGGKETLKRARRKLHQVYGAYLAEWNPRAAEAALAALPAGPSPAALRRACMAVLRTHHSTRERIALLDKMYASIFAVTGPPRRVLDLGCGVHPFAIPWMGLPAGARYEAWEIDSRMVDLAGGLFGAAGVDGRACCKDVLVAEPAVRADVVFLLKMLPCLERQRRGAGPELLRALRARFAVVSFPAASLSGRPRGMRRSYAAAMEGILRRTGWRAVRLEWPEELVFVVDRRPVSRSAGGA